MRDREMNFGPILVRYTEAVLEPRPWTVSQARWAAELTREVPEGPMLELCSGAGHIGQAAAHWCGRHLVQVDIDPGACELAEANASANGMASVVEVRCGDLGKALRPGERFSIVLADPPYLPSDEVGQWPGDPELAVDGGGDGLTLPRECLRVAAAHVHDGGAVLLQALGQRQIDRLGADIDECGLTVSDVRSEDDRRAVALLRPVR